MPQVPKPSWLNESAARLTQSPALALSNLVAEKKRNGLPTVDLAFGRSPFPVIPGCQEALTQRVSAGFGPPEGLELTRAAVSKFLSLYGVQASEDTIVVGPGSKALHYLFRLAFRGQVIAPTPVWFPHIPQADLTEGELRLLPTRPDLGYRIDIEQLAQLTPAGPTALLLNSPANPTGLSLSPDELSKIAAWARKHNVLIVSDEINGPLHHKNAHRSIAEHYPEGTLVTTGLSKWSGADAFRFGAMHIPNELSPLRRTLIALSSELFTTTSTPVQLAAAAAFEPTDAHQTYLQQVRRVLAAVGRSTSRRFVQAGFRAEQPEGGFVMLVDATPHQERLAKKGIDTGAKLASRILSDLGVAVLPGSVFGLPGDSLTFRIAYVAFDGQSALEAVFRVPREQPLDAHFLERHCQSVIHATDQIIAFVTSN